MSLRFSLREHKVYAAYTPNYYFNKDGSSTKVRIDSYSGGSSSMGQGMAFIVVNRAWLHGKYIRWNWNGYFSRTTVSSIAYLYIYDGSYDRSSDTDFPSGAAMATKGNGLLQTLAIKSVGAGNWGPETLDVQADVDGGSEEYCTLMFRLNDAWSSATNYLDIDWLEINSSSGGSGNLYSEHFTDSVTMEVIGTTGDYGYISTGEVALEQIITSTGIEQTISLGMPKLTLTVKPSGIAQAIALGTPTVSISGIVISPQGISVIISYGTPALIQAPVIIPSGIEQLIAIGVPALSYQQTISPSGITVTISIGTLSIAMQGRICPVGISQAIAIGSATITKFRWHVILEAKYQTGSQGVNKAYVIGRDSNGDPVYGESTNSTEIALVGERLEFDLELEIPTTTLAEDVAEAILAKRRLSTKKGYIVIPPNCGVELWDVVRLTDTPANQSAQNYRIAGIRFEYHPRQAKFQHKLLLGAL